ncbi:Ala-tRNA(Pro) deacylase [Thiogranum longum]|uniref:Ala-tRNA(Pro) deacylase n=1 Tax=Thiogranum longum TaxID=1537524 RepID=A0A4R1HAQ2_9GAMM|nr:YbaK/EbsC family protein [Thiogranum longum]TCK17255.1 Ala-tRNA(Pro) deacylase [Thiogranum longum]
MAMANRVVNYLLEQDVDFDLLDHPHSATSMESAQLAHISGDRIAKSVVLEDERGYLLVVVPASCRVDLGELHRLTRRNLGLATEYELGALFEDCEPGAVPPLGPAYDLETIVDETLAEQPDIYFEAGDHEQLVHVSGETFETLLGEAQHTDCSRHL